MLIPCPLLELYINDLHVGMIFIVESPGPRLAHGAMIGLYLGLHEESIFLFEHFILVEYFGNWGKRLIQIIRVFG